MASEAKARHDRLNLPAHGETPGGRAFSKGALARRSAGFG
jgi:hypothetical protein